MKNKKNGLFSAEEIVDRLISVCEDLHNDFYLCDKLPSYKRLFLSSLISELRFICLTIKLSDIYEE